MNFEFVCGFSPSLGSLHHKPYIKTNHPYYSNPPGTHGYSLDVHLALSTRRRDAGKSCKSATLDNGTDSLYPLGTF